MKNNGVWSEWVTSWTSHAGRFAFLCKTTPLCADPPLIIEQFPDGVDLREKWTQLSNCVTDSNLNSFVCSYWACNPRNGTSPVDHWPQCCLCWVGDSFTWVRATHSITKTLAQDQKETLHRLSSRRFRSRASNARNTVCICRLRSRRLCRESMDSWGECGGRVRGLKEVTASSTETWEEEIEEIKWPEKHDALKSTHGLLKCWNIPD